jgi:hypothetical protein
LPTITGCAEGLAPRPRSVRFGAHSRSKTKLPLATTLLLAALASEPVEIGDSRFELKPPPVSLRATGQDCRRAAAAGEIVVCGRNADEYRLKELKPPAGIEVDEGGVIGFDIGGARVEPTLNQVTMPDGRISKRFMVTVKMPF